MTTATVEDIAISCDEDDGDGEENGGSDVFDVGELFIIGVVDGVLSKTETDAVDVSIYLNIKTICVGGFYKPEETSIIFFMREYINLNPQPVRLVFPYVLITVAEKCNILIFYFKLIQTCLMF